MKSLLSQITLDDWDTQYESFRAAGVSEPDYGGPLRRHTHEGDLRLLRIKYDPSIEALNLWNFLLTEEDRLHAARLNGKKIVGTMKDLGTVPLMAYALPDIIAFYPDGAWWIPCVMELGAGLLGVADSIGLDESFCPVRAMVGAFLTEAHFPIPDLLICSVGAVCDDFSAIAQRLNGLGYPIHWWEIPHRRHPDTGEPSVMLPGGAQAPVSQLEFVRSQFEGIKRLLEDLSGQSLTDDVLMASIRTGNRVRRLLKTLRTLTFTSEICPMPALELLIAEMLAIHFCSDPAETIRVLSGLVDRVRSRVEERAGFFGEEAVRIFWVNPVADLTAMNMLEECGGRICGTEYLFTHALDEIPEDMPPMDALAQMALADPMVGSAQDRARRVCNDLEQFGSEGLIISKIPGASHCALEGARIAERVQQQLGLPVLEIEVPPVCDAVKPSLRGRISALLELIRERRHR